MKPSRRSGTEQLPAIPTTPRLRPSRERSDRSRPACQSPSSGGNRAASPRRPIEPAGSDRGRFGWVASSGVRFARPAPRRGLGRSLSPGRPQFINDGLANALQAPPRDVRHLHLAPILSALRGSDHGLVDHLKRLGRRHCVVVDERLENHRLQRKRRRRGAACDIVDSRLPARVAGIIPSGRRSRQPNRLLSCHGQSRPPPRLH
jgi:hypothetical protein